MVEISQRTIQGRFLLKPSPRLNQIVVGCLARAQKLTAARIYAVAVLSNHFHLLASFETVEHMARFMGHFKANLSKEVGRLHDWSGPMFGRRYDAIPLSDEPEIQLQRLRYILSQGAKEGLVLSPTDWPGVQCAAALAGDRPLRGVWVDRTRLFAARHRGESLTEADCTTQEVLDLAPLPCWQHFSKRRRCAEIAAMLDEIEREAAALHAEQGTEPAGTDAVLRRSPHFRPNQVARSPKPRFHAATKAVRRLLLQAFREFLIAYRLAAERLAGGDRSVVFPADCFPPRMAFTGSG